MCVRAHDVADGGQIISPILPTPDGFYAFAVQIVAGLNLETIDDCLGRVLPTEKPSKTLGLLSHIWSELRGLSDECMAPSG